jgi:hypothetical protein
MPRVLLSQAPAKAQLGQSRRPGTRRLPPKQGPKSVWTNANLPANTADATAEVLDSGFIRLMVSPTPWLRRVKIRRGCEHCPLAVSPSRSILKFCTLGNSIGSQRITLLPLICSKAKYAEACNNAFSTVSYCCIFLNLHFRFAKYPYLTAKPNRVPDLQNFSFPTESAT